MSRIGKMPVEIPQNVKVTLANGVLTVEGPKGKLSQAIRSAGDAIQVEVTPTEVLIKRSSDEKPVRALHGLYRALVRNMVIGVSQGYEKSLEIQGVGYKAALKGKDSVEVVVGYSHPVIIKAPEGVTLATEGNTRIKVSGPDKQAVGQLAATIRKVRKPEPYKGKGIRYVGEQVRKKAGKTTATA